jgi:ABC-type uncharacterized transport system permease subunit
VLEQMLTTAFLTGFLAATLRLATPILITALGELVAERSGVMNLGIEGIMIIGAFAGFAVGYQTGNPWFAFIVAGLAGALLGLLMAFLSVTLSANQIVAGLGIWIFCQGLASFLYRRFYGVTSSPLIIEVLEPVPIPLLSRIPILGETLFNQNVVVYLTLLAVPLLAFIFQRTAWGLAIDAAGENPHAADAAGLRVGKIRYIAVTFGGLMAGMGGAYLVLALYGLFTPDLSTGLGWIAIAVVIFGRWQPGHVLLGALIFGAAQALQFRLQAMDFPLPYQFLLMLPFLVTLLIVIFFVRDEGGPSALTRPFRRS